MPGVRMNAPKWFIQTEDGVLHGYFTLSVLVCDLALRPWEKVRIFEHAEGLTTRYEPVTEGELRERIRALSMGAA